MTAFELVLFSVDPAFVRRAVDAGVRTVIVDWEQEEKQARQLGVDTEINRHTVEDLRRVRGATDARLLCRVNPCGPATRQEVEQAVAAGADEVLVPMIRSVDDAEAVLELAAGRCQVGILLETRDALAAADRLARLPLSRVYMGLNDLAIERKTPSIFTPLVDGTLDEIRPLFRVPFGFGGLTLPDLGHPIPCRLLIGELTRLDCSFSFLRRSFHRDIRDRDPGVEVPRLLAALEGAAARKPDEVAADRAALRNAVEARGGGLAGAA